jgi:acetyltransferase-like isoleucine patch superfamily enzyme
MLEGCDIGRYCSIATGTKVMSEGHPIDRVTTSTITYGDKVANLIEKDFKVKIIQNRKISPSNRTQIGHDVYIGENVTIKRGVKIGNGSIFAGYSLVVKDVEPYSIVGGNPARMIKKRFTPEIITQLQGSKWWEMNPNEFSTLDLTNVVDFLGKFPRDIEHFQC